MSTTFSKCWVLSPCSPSRDLCTTFGPPAHVWVRWLQDISKFDPIFAGFTRYNLKFASLSKYNPFLWISGFSFTFDSPNNVNEHFYPCSYPSSTTDVWGPLFGSCSTRGHIHGRREGCSPWLRRARRPPRRLRTPPGRGCRASRARSRLQPRLVLRRPMVQQPGGARRRPPRLQSPRCHPPTGAGALALDVTRYRPDPEHRRSFGCFVRQELGRDGRWCGQGHFGRRRRDGIAGMLIMIRMWVPHVIGIKAGAKLSMQLVWRSKM
jgi:hypothetical protein